MPAHLIRVAVVLLALATSAWAGDVRNVVLVHTHGPSPESATGILLSPNSVLTVRHILPGAVSIDIVPTDWRFDPPIAIAPPTTAASWVALDHDLAVLRLTRSLPMAAPERLAVGYAGGPVATAGFAGGGTDMVRQSGDVTATPGVLWFVPPLGSVPGDSGSPVWSPDGAIVGIVSHSDFAVQVTDADVDHVLHAVQANNGPVGRPPVFRLVNIATGLTLYTANLAERNGCLGNGEWSDGSIAFYAGGSVPVYRFFWLRNGEHFLTANETERAGLASDPMFVFEGVVFGMAGNEVALRLPVWRVFNPANGDHVLTAFVAERNAMIASGMTAEGVGFWSPVW